MAGSENRGGHCQLFAVGLGVPAVVLMQVRSRLV